MSLTLNVAALLKNTRAAGPSLRDILWLQGCSINCSGCSNQAYLSHEKRVVMPIAQLISHFKARKNKINGCTISGGEPTEQSESLGIFLKEIKKLGLSTVVYTGHTLDYLKRDTAYQNILSYTDLLIDGPFIEQQKDDTLLWRGSKNQKLHFLNDYWKREEIDKEEHFSDIVLSDKRIIFHAVCN